MLWTSFLMEREDMVVFFISWIAAAETLYWQLIVLGSSYKIIINNLYTSFNSEDALVKLNDGFW